MSGEAFDPPSLGAATPIGVRGIPFPAEVIVVAVRWYLRYNGSSPGRCGR